MSLGFNLTFTNDDYAVQMIHLCNKYPYDSCCESKSSDPDSMLAFIPDVCVMSDDLSFWLNHPKKAFRLVAT